MYKYALIIGNSSGIGLGITEALLRLGWRADGISRSQSPLEKARYRHVQAGVQEERYPEILTSMLEENGPPDLCIYCAGIGERLDLKQMEAEIEIFEVNLLGMVRTAAVVIPAMVRRGSGHFIGLASLADEMISAEAPSYHAAKAGFSNYLEGLALALKPSGVRITNLRFGFVDTKMAKGEVRPFMMPVERAVEHLLKCIEKKPARYTAPKLVIPLVKFRRWMLRLQL